MTDKALEAAREALSAVWNRDGSVAEMTHAALSAYLSAQPGEAEVVEWTDDTDEQVPIRSRGVTRNSDTAKYWEHTAGAPLTPLVTLASLQAMQARAEVAEEANKALMDERTNLIETKRQQIDRLELSRGAASKVALDAIERAEAAEARVKELEEALAYAVKGLDMVHNGLMDPTRPRQSVGEVCAHFLSTALTGGSNG